MRENIGLFKAKRVDNGEWVQGYLFRNVGCKLGIKEEVFFIGYDFDDYEQIDPETLCECTGLKDKNGKLIFENDYVKQKIEKQGYSNGQPDDYYSFYGTIYGIVKFTPSVGFYIKVLSVEDEITGNRQKVNWKSRKRIVSYRTEVIGNKFDK